MHTEVGGHLPRGPIQSRSRFARLSWKAQPIKIRKPEDFLKDFPCSLRIKGRTMNAYETQFFARKGETP